MIFSYTMQFMVFPAYSELDHRSPSRFAWASFWSLVIYSFALIVTGVTCSLLFGKEIKPDLLQNMVGRPGGASVIIRCVYCFILVFHLPFIFFTLKEFFLVMYDEWRNKSLSSHLEGRIK